VDLTYEAHSDVVPRGAPAPLRIAPNAPTDADGTANAVAKSALRAARIRERAMRGILPHSYGSQGSRRSAPKTLSSRSPWVGCTESCAATESAEAPLRIARAQNWISSAAA